MTISKLSSEPNSASDEVDVRITHRWLIWAFALTVIIAASSLICPRTLNPFSVGCPPHCDYTPKYSPADFEYELEMNQSKWDSQHISHYQMVLDPWFSSANYGHTPYVIEVKDGEVISVVDAHGAMVRFQDEQSFAYSDRYFFTVPELFLFVHQTFLKQPPTIRVTYDATYGFPVNIYVDPYIEPCCQDYSINVDEFRVLP